MITGQDEVFFEECAITSINPTHIEFAVLRGFNAVEATRTSIALGALALPDTKAECDFEMAQRSVQKEMGQFPARYLPIDTFSTDEFSELEQGRIIHWHQNTVDKLICFSPKVLSVEQIKLAIDSAFDNRDTALRKQIANIEKTAFFERTKLEFIQPGEPFYLFEGAEVRQRQDGTDYIHIPPRILISERWGPRRIAVSARLLDLNNPDNDPLAEVVFTANQHIYRVGANQPFGDETQLGTVSNKVIRIEVLTSAPLGHETAHEEQKLEVKVNGIGYWAELDKEHLWETDYYPSDEEAIAMNLLNPDDFNSHMQSKEIGKQNIRYIHFTQVGEAEPNVVDITDGDEKTNPLPKPFMAHLVVPFDLTLLRDIEAWFPGI